MQAASTPRIRSTTHCQGGRRDALDISLLESVINGDHGAFRVLFIRHNVRIYRFVLRLTGNDFARRGNRQRGVPRSLAKRRSLRDEVRGFDVAPGDRPSQGACSAAAPLGIRDLDNEDLLLTIEDPADDPEECLDKQDRGTTLRFCLQQLSPAHREVIDLVYYHGKSVGEVAEIVGIPANTVKTRMHHARSRMAMLLEQAGIAGQRA